MVRWVVGRVLGHIGARVVGHMVGNVMRQEVGHSVRRTARRAARHTVGRIVGRVVVRAVGRVLGLQVKERAPLRVRAAGFPGTSLSMCVYCLRPSPPHPAEHVRVGL